MEYELKNYKLRARQKTYKSYVITMLLKQVIRKLKKKSIFFTFMKNCPTKVSGQYFIHNNNLSLLYNKNNYYFSKSNYEVLCFSSNSTRN